MDISDIDIYDDLDEFQQKEEKKSEELLTLEAKYKESLETIELMKVEIKTLRKQQRIIEVNFQNLLDTAKTELKRKNDQIAQLQREKDDICFRRKDASTSGAARARHKQLRDGAGSVASFSHHQQSNPFKQNEATKVPPHSEQDTAVPKTENAASQLHAEKLATTSSYKSQLSPIYSKESFREADNVGYREKTLLPKTPRYEEQKTQRRAHSNSEKDTAVPKTENAVSQLPAEQLATTTSYKRQLSPIDSDESFIKETDNTGYREKTQLPKKPRYEEQKIQRRAHSNSEKDEETTSSRRRERSHSRGRTHKINGDERNSSRHKFNRRQRSSDAEDRYSDYQRERRRERESENYHDRHQRTSREGRQRERHDSNHDRRHRKASRSDQERLEKTQNSKKSLETSNRLAPRKESLHNTVDAHESSKESNKKSFNKEYERHENSYEKRAQTKERTESYKTVIELERKEGQNPLIEKYKFQKNNPKEKPLKRDNREASMDTSKQCMSLDDYNKNDEAEEHTLPNTSLDRNSKQFKNNIGSNIDLDIDEKIAEQNHSNSSSDTIIFDIANETDIKNSSNKMANDMHKDKSNDNLSTPKKVALFDALFGQQAGDGTTTNKSKLLNNVLDILKNDTTKGALNTNTTLKKDDEGLSSDLSKKQNYAKTIEPIAKDNDSLDSCSLKLPKSAEHITQSATKNMEVAKKISKTINTQLKELLVKFPKEESSINKHEVIEITDDTDIDSTDEEIVFFNVEAPIKHSDTTKPVTSDLEKTTAADSLVQVAKGDKTKKPVIEIIEDIRLPAVLPIKQILKIHEETSSQKQQVIANKDTKNLSLLLHDGEVETKDNLEYSSNITVFNTDNELDISDQTDIIFDETNMSLEVVSDEEIDLEDKKESKAHSLTVDNDAQAKHNSEQRNRNSKETASAEQEKSLHNNTNELEKSECVVNKKLKGDKQTINQLEKDANAIVYLDIDEDYAQQQKQEKDELFDNTEEIQNKQEITLCTKEETTHKAIDSNINTFDMQIEEENPDNCMDTILPVANMSEDIKATLIKKDFIASNVADMKLLAESSEKHESEQETVENVLIASNDEQLEDIISVNHNNLSKVADENHVDADEDKIVISDVKNSVNIDQLQSADEFPEHSPPHAVVDVIISDDQEVLVDVAQDIIHNSIENLAKNGASENMELTTLNTIIFNEQSNDITNSLDKIENIVEVEKRRPKLPEELKEKNSGEKNIKITPDQAEDATKDANNLESNEVVCDKPQIVDKPQVVETNINNIISHNPEKIRDAQEKISNNTKISNQENTENHEEIECAVEINIISENNTNKEVKPTNETDEETITNIEMDAIEVGLIEVEADMKELEVDLQIYENDNNNTKETLKPEVLMSNSIEDDIIMSKDTLHDNDELSKRTNIIPGNHDIALNKELQKEFKAMSKHEDCQKYSNHIVQNESSKMLDMEHREEKASESFKKCVASLVRRATSKSKSEEITEERNNCSEFSIESLNEASYDKITTNLEKPKTELVQSSKDQRVDKKLQAKLLLKENSLPVIKQPYESIPKAKPADDKTEQQLVPQISLKNDDDNKHSAHDTHKKENKMTTDKIIKNESTEYEIKKTELSSASIAKDEPKKADLKALKHTEFREPEKNIKIQELAINQLRELSAIGNPDGKYYTSSEDERCFSPQELPRHPRNKPAKEKHSRYNSPAKIKNYFKIIVAPKVEDRKRKLPDGYKIPKLKQPKVDTVDESKNTPKSKSAATYKAHKENLLNKEKEEKKVEKALFPTVKNSTKTNSSKTASCCKKTAKKSNFVGEVDDKQNIPYNNNLTSTSVMEQKKSANNMETKPLIQSHKLESCDPRNPLYSSMNNIRVNKIKQKVNEKLLETQQLVGDNEKQAPQISTAIINANSLSELKPTTKNTKNTQVLPNMQSLVSFSTNRNQTKSKHFRRILDSSSGDEISDEQNINRIESQRLNANQLQATAANLITPNREPKRKKIKKRRVVLVTTSGEATKTPQPEIQAPPAPPAAPTPPAQAVPPVQPVPQAQPVPPAPIRAPPTPILAPPTPDHAIFHTEPDSNYLYATSALPQFNNLQDKQYTDIDSRLQSMFQSPPYVADQQTHISKNLLSPIQHDDTSMSPTMEQQTSLNGSSSKSTSNSETKRLSLGTSQYLVEKVSENVVNVFITRKRHKKKTALPTSNNTAKLPEHLTSVSGGSIA